MPLSMAAVAAAVDGRLDAGADPTAEVLSVTIDSRTCSRGALFVALAGTRVDGSHFAADAVAAGATGVLTARPLGVPAVVVGGGHAGVVAALGRLARAALDRLPATTVIGITGSSGKTSTKDLLAVLLGRLGPTVAATGSYNNDIGHPLTVLRADAGSRFLVLECSARGVGHIARLCRIAPPDVGVVLNVGSAHLGEFGSRAEIARAKGELVEGLPANGLAVLNTDDPAVAAMAERTTARVLRFGSSERAGGRADVRAEDVMVEPSGRPAFTLAIDGARARVRLGLYGEHQVSNALAAAGVAWHAGMPVDQLGEALSAARPGSRWRMEVTDRADGVRVVNDAYNANPESMRAALKALAAMSTARRSWAVLGAMGELGQAAAAEHDAIGRLAVRLNISRLVAVGPDARLISAGAELEGSWANESVAVPDVEAALALLRAEIEPGDVVLVKASRAGALERVAAALVADCPPADELPDGVRR